MKKILSLILVAILILSLIACNNEKNKKAFEASKAAYDNVNAAYEITANFGADIYEAWRCGIFDKDELLSGGCTYFSKNLHISKDEISISIAHNIAEILGEKWDDISEERKDKYLSIVDSFFEVMDTEDDLFTWCVQIITDAYTINGKVDEIESYLTEAKAQMKELSEKYSDYEHYPALKGYYTTTSSFFDLCQNPTGSFEQLKTTIENYKTTARDYKANLDFIFED